MDIRAVVILSSLSIAVWIAVTSIMFAIVGDRLTLRRIAHADDRSDGGFDAGKIAYLSAYVIVLVGGIAGILRFADIQSPLTITETFLLFTCNFIIFIPWRQVTRRIGLTIT